MTFKTRFYATAALLAFVAFASSASADQIQFFPPVNIEACNATTALMFNGTSATTCGHPSSASTPQFTFPSSDGKHTYSVPLTLTCTTINTADGRTVSRLFVADETFTPTMIPPDTQGDGPRTNNIDTAPGDSILYYPTTQGAMGGVAYALPSGAGAQMLLSEPRPPLPTGYGCPASIPVQVQ